MLAPANAPTVPRAIWLSLNARAGEAVRSAPWGAPLAAAPTASGLSQPLVILRSGLAPGGGAGRYFPESRRPMRVSITWVTAEKSSCPHPRSAASS